MPKFTLCLAHDVSHYGTTEVEAPTWEDALRSLTDDDWWDVCRQRADDSTDLRIVHVEDPAGEMVAEDVAFGMQTVDAYYVLHRLKRLRAELPPGAVFPALNDFIRDMKTHHQDPVFKEQGT